MNFVEDVALVKKLRNTWSTASNQKNIIDVEDIATLDVVTGDVIDRLRLQTDRIKVFLESVDP